MGDQSERQFPIVYSFDGAASADGTALLVEATGFDGSVMRFAIPIDNVKHFIAFLLVWIGTISATHGDDAEVAGASTLPIPATSIAIGEPSGEEGYIGIAVGRAELDFSLPLSALAPIGRTLLMAATGPQSSVGN
jgi:hypothetical protein